MFKKVFLSFFIGVFALTISVPQAQAVSLNEALQRMDAILAQMEALRAEFATLSSSVQTQTPAVLGSQSTPVLTQSLQYGDTNTDIEKVQKLLATDPSIYPYGVASGFFGPKTQEAIRNFQARFGLDTVGVIGPATKSLLELFLAAYPSGNYPANVLQSKPQVQGASTSVTPTPTTPTTPTYTGTNPAKSINVTFDGDESLIEIVYANGNRKGLIAPSVDKATVVTFIASRTTLTQAQINAVISYEKVSSSSSSSGADEEDAEDAIDDAEDAIDDAFDAIEEADDDGDDVDWAEETLEEAEDLLKDAEDAYDDEDYDEAVDLAEEAEEMAEKAEDRIDKEEGDEKGDNDEIEEIIADVDDGESEITVEYEDGNEYVFTVEEDDEDDIIAEVADELDMDEDDVEDLIEFDFGKIDRITVRLDDESLVRIFYTSGVERRMYINSDDEDDIIEELADELDEDEDDIEDMTDFD